MIFLNNHVFLFDSFSQQKIENKYLTLSIDKLQQIIFENENWTSKSGCAHSKEMQTRVHDAILPKH